MEDLVVQNMAAQLYHGGIIVCLFQLQVSTMAASTCRLPKVVIITDLYGTKSNSKSRGVNGSALKYQVMHFS